MSELRLIQYSEKSIALLGNSKHLYDQLMSMKIGVWNKHLTYEGKKCEGWIFANKHKQTVESLISGTAVVVSQKEVVDKKEVVNKKYSILELEKYLMANLSVLIECIGAEMKIGSVVMNDLTILPDDGKRYLLLGGGLGFSHIICDKRNKLAVKIIEDSNTLKRKIDNELTKCIEPSYLKKLEASGNPLSAHLFQNLAYKDTYNSLVIKFMENYVDTKKVYIKSMLD